MEVVCEGLRTTLEEDRTALFFELFEVVVEGGLFGEGGEGGWGGLSVDEDGGVEVEVYAFFDVLIGDVVAEDEDVLFGVVVAVLEEGFYVLVVLESIRVEGTNLYFLSQKFSFNYWTSYPLSEWFLRMP